MDSFIYLPTIGLGAVLIIIYLSLCRKQKRKIELPNMVNLVLYASGVIGGLLLLGACVSHAVFQKLTDIKVYIFIAGLAVLYVSIKGAWKELTIAEEKEPLDSDQP